MSTILDPKKDSKIPEGPLAEKWTNYKAHQKLVNPANKRRLDIIVVGTGLAGASAAASLGEMGFNVLNFCIQDSPPRRAHSIAAQGVSMLQRIIKTMVTLFTVFSTIQSKVVTTVPVKLTYTVWLKLRTASSTSVLLREFLLPVNMELARQPFFRWSTGVTYILCQRTNRTTAIVGSLLCVKPSGT